MRTAIIAAGLFVAAATVGQADTPWSGFYAGVGVGFTSYGQVLATRSAEINGVPQALDDPRGITGHAFGGYRRRNGAMVWGGELEAQIGNASFGVSSCADGGEAPCASAGLVGDLSTTGRLRLTAGYLVDDRTLLFGSVGFAAAAASIDGVYAVTHIDGPPGLALAAFGPPASTTAVGYTLGLGVEHLVAPRMSLRFGITYDRLVARPGFSSWAQSLYNVPPDLAIAVADQDEIVGFRNLGVAISAVYRF